MSEDPVMKLRLEAWKTTIQVQQHFNDIEWKIRGLALTLITGVLGASAFAAKDGTVLHLEAFDLKLSAAILIAGEVVWLSFFFVDKIWYHRLLIGSVQYGTILEESFGNALPGPGLTRQISAASKYSFRWFSCKNGKERVLRSDTKLTTFYLVIAVLLLILAAGAQIGVTAPAKATTKATPSTTTNTSSTSTTTTKPVSSSAVTS